uniref:Uncharacterized protein n=1 Tax=Micrurus corallinus TaxID=54390 RepID=A0A2D4H3U2_MICCO
MLGSGGQTASLSLSLPLPGQNPPCLGQAWGRHPLGQPPLPFPSLKRRFQTDHAGRLGFLSLPAILRFIYGWDGFSPEERATLFGEEEEEEAVLEWNADFSKMKRVGADPSFSKELFLQ